MTTQAIADKLGFASQTIQKWLHRHDIPVHPRGNRRGAKHPNWKGGVTRDKSGYLLRYAPEHPDANKSGYVREHRLVMEQAVGRRLERAEVVHHKGGRADNSPDKLRLYSTNAEHLADELKGRCPKWTEDGWRRILEASRLPLDDASIVERYQGGESSKEIAKSFGCSQSTILKRLKKHGIPLTKRPSKSKYTWPSNEQLIALYRTQSLIQIAASVGCSIGSVAARLQRLGVAMRQRGKAGLNSLLREQESMSHSQSRCDAQAS